MALSLIDVLVVMLAAIAVGFGLGIGAALVHVSILSFMRYALDYAEKLKQHRINEHERQHLEDPQK